uniref:MHC class I-like antigen recognition-like domain-containing protein n=1 Tax=Dicentrarchus labrax TaxID=13489 RepID=A0A8C4DJK8_DICLA
TTATLPTTLFHLNLGARTGTTVTLYQYEYTLKTFIKMSEFIPNFPEFVTVGLVDEFQTVHYDSNTRRAEPKQDWMSRVTAEDPQYWERETQTCLGKQQAFKANIETAKQRFNQTGGVHVAQRMYGCEWDDDTGEVNGYDQWGYDGEDFIAFDLKTETWTAPVPQAVITKHKWDNNKAEIALYKNYLIRECIDWLKKYFLTNSNITINITNIQRLTLSHFTHIALSLILSHLSMS